MSVVSKTEKLKIYAAKVMDDLIVIITGLFSIRLTSIWYESMVFSNIDMIK